MSTSRPDPLSVARLGICSLVPLPKKVMLIDEVPQATMVEWGVKLYTLMQLAWNYIDTILDQCASLRLHHTKPLVREVRALRRRYDQFRAHTIDTNFERKEAHNAETFEEKFQMDFDHLFHGLDMDIRKLSLPSEEHLLILSVQQALTVMDAVRQYARWCDQQIAGMGIFSPDCCLVQGEFLDLYPIIPRFAGCHYQPRLESRSLTARILCNRMIESIIEVRGV